MAALECKLAMVINTLVEFELLLELKIEQKHGTSLDKLVLSRRKSGLRIERLSVPVIYFGYRDGIHSDLAIRGSEGQEEEYDFSDDREETESENWKTIKRIKDREQRMNAREKNKQRLTKETLKTTKANNSFTVIRIGR
jgi:hypothetical protein